MVRDATIDLNAVWPRWMAYAFAATGLALGVVVATQPRPFYPLGVRVALSVVPALAWSLCIVSNRRYFFIVGPVVFASVGVLLLHASPFDAAPFFLLLLIADAVGETPVWAGAAVAVACAALMVGLDLAGRFEGSLVWVMAFAFTWAGAALVQSRMKLLDVVSERAAFEERQRIARELHDVIAHSLAVTMLQLTGARLALERDPKDAAHALAEAERLGRQSLAEIRRAVGLLAPSDETPLDAPPTAADVPELVAAMSDAGLDVTLHSDGDLAAVAPGSGLAVYRIVQESLANVVKHAPGA